MKNMVATDPTYQKMVGTYDKTDAVLAVGVYLSVLLLYLGAGYLLMTVGSILPAILANIVLIGIVLVCLRIRKQKLSTVGITLCSFKRSFIVGATIGLVLSICGNIVPTVLSGGQWAGAASMLWNFFYMLVVIAFMEELVFRGYIQTRLYGMIQSDALANVVGGLMFTGMHIPFQLFNRNGGNVVDFLTSNALWLLSTFIMHLLFNFLYRKYNSLTAPTACHFLMNFGSTLFQ